MIVESEIEARIQRFREGTQSPHDITLLLNEAQALLNRYQRELNRQGNAWESIIELDQVLLELDGHVKIARDKLEDVKRLNRRADRFLYYNRESSTLEQAGRIVE